MALLLLISYRKLAKIIQKKMKPDMDANIFMLTNL